MTGWTQWYSTIAARAQARWPGLVVPSEVFVPYAEARLPADSSLDESNATDLYLACACASGDSAALALLDGLLKSLGGVTRRAEHAGVSPEDVRQSLRERLLVTAAGAPPKITQYTGKGPLVGWLRTAALRAALNLARTAPAAVELGDLSAPGHDPELDYIHAHHRDDFKAAFRLALTDLSKRQRSLLRFQVLEGLSLEQIGSTYHVSRATAARWLAEARELLLNQTRRHLAESLQLRPDQMRTLMSLLGDRLDLSITSFLRR